jgi:hypothetical protein
MGYMVRLEEVNQKVCQSRQRRAFSPAPCYLASVPIEFVAYAE